jgi:lysophospholipase L1-like esterase
MHRPYGIQIARVRRTCWLGIIAFSLGLMLPGFAAAKHDSTWVGTWATAVKVPSLFDPPFAADPPFNDQTLRQIVRISVGGEKVRVWLTNVDGTAPLQVAAAAVAIRNEGASIVVGSSQALSFGGAANVSIAPGARVVSDPVDLKVSDLADLAVSIHVPDGGAVAGSPVSYHVRGLQTSYVISGGQTEEVDPFWDSTIDSTFWLAAVDVLTKKNTLVFAAFGDSITDGDLSTPDANQRWPNLLAEGLLTGKGKGNGKGKAKDRVGVLNLGISGNQVTNAFIGDSALTRFERDVRLQTGVTHVLVLEGINDIGLPPFLNLIGIPVPTVEAHQIIAAYKQLIAQAHADGLKIIGGTITPSGNFVFPGSDYATDAGEEKRQLVNEWIRTSGEFDDVVDFDALLRDPDDPTILRVDLSPDGLHFNDTGYQMMADEVIRELFDDDDD